DHPREQRLADRVRERGERALELWAARGGPLLDACQILVLQRYPRQVQGAPCLVLHAPAPQRLAQLVAGDAEQPRDGLAGPVPGLRPRGDDREGLRREVERQLGFCDPAAEEGDDGVQVRPVERGERTLVAAGDALEQLAVVTGHPPSSLRGGSAV